MMRRPLLLAAACPAIFLVAGRIGATAADFGRFGGGNNQNVGGSAPASSTGGSVGAGSFTRPAAPSMPEPQPGGQREFGGRLPAGNTFVPAHPPPVVRSAPIEPGAAVIYPKTSVPTFVAPPNSRNLERERFKPDGTQAGSRGRVPGEAFITMPGVAGTGTTAAHGLPRTANTGLGTMPAVQQHLQKNGQTLQAWSAGREQLFTHWHQQNAARIAEFERNRVNLWKQVRGQNRDLVRMAREHGADWDTYRQELWRFRSGRADQIRDRIRDGCDDLFTFDWWRRHHHRGFDFVLGNSSPWWWWNPCPWNRLVLFGGYGWNAPIYYDYGANVIVDGDVYFDGEDNGSSADYAQQAIQLANPSVDAGGPTPPQDGVQSAEWQPFGVFAFTPEAGGDATMFFELAVNKTGLIGGAFTNILTDESEPVTGAIDPATQRAAWHVGDKTDTVYESSAANLTLDVAPILVHFGTQSAQTWLLTRLPSPDMPAAPVSVAPQP
jgi:hypothetical protein